MCIEVNPSPYKIKCIFSQYIKHINELSIGEVWQYEAAIKWTSYWINTSTWFISYDRENIVNKFYHSYFNRRRELNSCWAWFKETLQKLGTDINNLQMKPCWICLIEAHECWLPYSIWFLYAIISDPLINYLLPRLHRPKGCSSNFSKL